MGTSVSPWQLVRDNIVITLFLTMLVTPGRYCSPRHPSHCELSFLESGGIL
jgi:hypothetical protein